MLRFSISPWNNHAPFGVCGLLVSIRCAVFVGCIGMMVSASPVDGGSVSGAVEGEFMRRYGQIFEAEKLIVAGDDLLATEDFSAAVASYAQAYNGLTPSPTSERINPLSPPLRSPQQRLQGHPAKSKFLAVNFFLI